MNQVKFVTNKAVMPGLTRIRWFFCYSLDSCPRFYGGKFIPAKAGTGMTNERIQTYEIIDKWRGEDLVIVGFLAFHTTGASPRSYPHARWRC